MNTQAEPSVRELIEKLMIADRVMGSHGLVWGERYEELKKPIRKARADLDAALDKADALAQSQRAEIDRLRAALLDGARRIEALKQACGECPESATAIQNGRYMGVSHFLRAARTKPEQE